MSKGNLIKMQVSEAVKFIELLDYWGVTPEDLAKLRKASEWRQRVTARVISGEPYLLDLLSVETSAKIAGFTSDDFKLLTGGSDLMK